MAQYTGVVRWFNNAKGFGFLGVDGGQDVFVHYSAVQQAGYRDLREGDRVEFDISTGTDGRPRAEAVRKLDTTPTDTPAE